MDIRRSMMKSKGSDDMGNWETIREFSEIGVDTNRLNILSRNPKGYVEIYFVFFGRENNADDSLPNGNGSDNITINNVRAIVKSLVYIRGKGAYFYASGKIELVNDFIVGQVARDEGNGGTNIMAIHPIQTKAIESISMFSNNLLKADSKLAVYAR